MCLDINKKFFMMSFRYNKHSLEDFGLIQPSDMQNIYIDASDNSEWVKQELYDFGWGNENGFTRLPKLQFNELWYLITNSPIQENQYGAAHIIEHQYPDELLKLLLQIFERSDEYIDKGTISAFKILKLHEPRNRSTIIGKSFTEIDKDYKAWKEISERVKKLIV